MSRWTSVLVLAAVAAAVVTGTAQARWVPGQAYRVSEQDAEKALEQKFDHAFCTGVPRFGHDGEFPDEEFHVLDCSIELNGDYCPGARIAAVKGNQPGYFRLRLMKTGECY